MRISDWSSDVCSSDLMIGAMGVKQVGGVDGHRAVEVDRNRGQTTGRLQFPKMVEQRLGSTDGEGGDQNGSTTRDRPLDDAAKRFGRVGRAVDAVAVGRFDDDVIRRSEEHTSELQSLMRISYAVFCLKKKKLSSNH